MVANDAPGATTGRSSDISLVVVAALREELRPLLRRLERRERVGRGSVRGLLGDVPILCGFTGAGVRNAERGVRALLERAPERVPLVGIGVAGALSPGLVAETLVLGEVVREGAAVRSAQSEWVRRGRRAGARPGTVLTVDEVIASGERKRGLWQELGRPDVAVVDMESARWAAAARAEGRPFLVVRAVSDEADEDLPPYLEACRDGSGGLDRGRVLRRALAQPSSFGALLRLRRRLERGAWGLAGLVVRLLEELPTSRAGSPTTAATQLEEAS